MPLLPGGWREDIDWRFDLIRVYNRFGRTYLFDIDFYFLKPEYGHDQTIYCIDAYHAGNVSGKIFEYIHLMLIMQLMCSPSSLDIW